MCLRVHGSCHKILKLQYYMETNHLSRRTCNLPFSTLVSRRMTLLPMPRGYWKGYIQTCRNNSTLRGITHDENKASEAILFLK